MEKVLYRHKGGGYFTNAQASNLNFGRGTWPFAQLTLGTDGLKFKLFQREVDIKFSDIKQVELSKTGYVVIRTADPQNDFGFTGIGLKKIITLLQSSGVKLETSTSSNLMTASLFLYGQLLFAIVFFVFFFGFIIKAFIH